MSEIRCIYCNQLLLKASYCLVEIKCPRCKQKQIIDFKKDRVSSTTIDSK